jgi:Glycosyltransferase Family 4/Glycosyl transferases group 1
MNKIMILDSSYPINSRNTRIYNYLKLKYDVKVVTWDRKAELKEYVENYSVFSQKANYGNKLEKLKKIPNYYKFIKNIINEFKPDLIIASNWDMLAMAALYKRKKHYKLVYENRDMVSTNSVFIKKVLSLIERLALKKADAIIFASRFFLNQYGYFSGEKVVIENKVSRNITKYPKTKSDKLRVSFIGSVRFYNILVNLLEVGMNIPEIKINIFGEGPDRVKLQKVIEEKRITNVEVHGRFDYQELGKLYSETDLLWSVYPNTTSSNKKLVIPNKYYESIYFRTPGLFPDHTETGKMVKDQDIGYVVNPYSKEDIYAVLKYILDNKADIEIKVKNMSLLKDDVYWDDEILKINDLIN